MSVHNESYNRSSDYSNHYASAGQAVIPESLSNNITAAALTTASTLSRAQIYDGRHARYQADDEIPLDRFLGSSRDSSCKSSFELVMIALTIPLWTFITLYLVLLLIYYLRRLQYFCVYDKCTTRNAHFRYDFHLVVGRHSNNYGRSEAIILDLLDNQSVSTVTIQIPGATIFNDHQVFVYRHARNNIRCVNFTVYRRQPFKDIKSVRVAHSCSAQDSRIFIYGLDIHDETNNESKFFPIQSVVKYRGTQWALLTTFEPKAELSFKKLGVDCYDPFGYSAWPTYLETLTILLYIWCSSFCFGHLISIKEISNSIPLHALTVLFIVASSAAVISAIYLRIIKAHILDLHYDSFWWLVAQQTYAILVIVVSIGFWSLALNQAKLCRMDSFPWLISTFSCSLILTMLVLFAWIISNLRRASSDRALLAETDANLAKTNSKEMLPFTADPALSICAMLMPQRLPTADTARTGSKVPSTGAAATANPVCAKNSKASGSGNKHKQDAAAVAAAAAARAAAAKTAKTGDDETLETAFGETKSKYMRNKNRNSISQYV